MTTKINVYSTSGTAFITSGTIDLYHDVPISLTYNIADIKEPNKRNGNFSKTITVPGTNNNNNFLGHIYEIGVDRLFNPNKKAEARILTDGIQVFKGFMRLDKVRSLRENKIEYDLVITGNLSDIFTTVTDKKLIDLSWSDLNHTYNYANQYASWNAPTGVGYIYPFIDYGYSVDEINYNVTNFFPGVYVKEIWDRIFSYAGYQYSSTFLTSSFFKSLFVPFNSDNFKLSSSQIASREFKASRLTSDKQYVYGTSGTVEYKTVIFNDDSTGTDVDGGGNYNTTTGIYTVPSNGYYNFNTNVSLYATASPVGANQYINYSPYSFVRIIKNGVAVAYSSNYRLGLADSSTHSTVVTSSTVNNINISYSSFLNAGDTLFVQLETTLTQEHAVLLSPANVNYSIYVLTTSYFQAQVNPILTEGDTVTMVNAIPQDTKISDFLLSIIKAFNLYIEYDKDTPNKLLIEDRNTFYNSNVQNWSTLLDTSKELEITPMGALDAKRYKFTYKKDSDYLNELYTSSYIGTDGQEETYGQRIKEVDNDFLKNENKVELIFSPTPQFRDGTSDRVFPKIIKVDSNGKITPKASNIRLLTYNGLLDCQEWKLQSTSGLQRLTQYPYCGHIDDPDNPSFDLNFGVPKEVFYSPSFGATYTNNNLYNAYWRQFIEEITDKNSSIVIGWFYLRPSDILQVDFRHLYYFKEQYFRLNKIYDYNPTKEQLTKCEFIKIKAGVPFTTHRAVLNAGYDVTFLDGGDIPPRSIYNNGSIVGSAVLYDGPKDKNVIVGVDNIIDSTASAIMVLGNGNLIGANSSNIALINSSGCIIAGGLTNVNIQNSSGVTVTTSNTSVINGVVTSSPTLGAAGQWYASGNDIYNGNSGNVGVGTLSTPATKLHVKGTSTVLTVEESSSATSSARNVVIDLATSTGNMVDGFGAQHLFRIKDNAGVDNNIGTIKIVRDTNDGSGKFSIATYSSGVVNTDGLTIDSFNRVYGTGLHNNSAPVTGTTNQYIASGTYTPTISNTVNLDATPSATQAQWMRVGNVVTVSGGLSAVNPTATATITTLYISVPINSAFTNTYECLGNANAPDIANMSGSIRTVAANNAQLYFKSSDTTAIDWTYSFTYLIK